MSTHRLYNFPPLFTLQVNAQTRRKQQELWSDIVMAFCEAQKQPMLDVASCPLFRNERIRRALSAEDAAVILDYLVASKRVRCGSSSLLRAARPAPGVVVPLSRRAACVRGFLDLPLSYHYGFCVDKWALVLVSSPRPPWVVRTG
jgi:hypothetical protein